MTNKLFKKAQKYMPGGVNSPVRAFAAVGCDPVYIDRGRGSKLYAADGKSYIDLVGSWGSLILGHAYSPVIAAVKKALAKGVSFGACSALEIELAELIISAFPSIDKVRLVSSGTEAVMSAIRLARGYTGRDKVIKFEGCYHGHVDSLLVKAGSGLATFGVPASDGVPASFTRDTIVLPFNDPDAVEGTLKKQGKKIAALIIEPIPGNMGVVLPKPGYLSVLRNLTRHYGIVLIFDEVISGFRVAFGGAQEVFGIPADLTCLGKIIGGGFPVGAFGGRQEIMDCLSPLGAVYQAGTLSGNPIGVTAGIAMLKILKNKDVYKKLEAKGEKLEKGLRKAAAGRPITINRFSSLLTLFFTEQEVINFKSAQTSDLDKFKKFFQLMLQQGVYLPPSQFEACFLSAVHTDNDLEKIITSAEKAIALNNT